MTNNTTIITGTAPEIVFEPETDQGKLCACRSDQNQLRAVYEYF